MNKLHIALIISAVLIVVLGLILSPTVTSFLNSNPTITPSFSLSTLPSISVSSSPQININTSIKIQSSNYRDSDGLTSKEKLGAIAIVLNNSTLKDTLNNTIYTDISIGNVTALNASKAPTQDSGYLNMPLKIAYVSVECGGRIQQLNYVVYVDVLNNTTLGLIEYGNKWGPMAYVTIPPSSTWYHQIMGANFTSETGNYVRMTPALSLNVSDVGSTSPIILNADNFKKFKNGKPYKALTYTDYVTNKTCIADGSQPINIVSTYNGTAVWIVNVSIDEKYLGQKYYMVVENKNKDKELNVTYWAS